jgi:hypothetical protein
MFRLQTVARSAKEARRIEAAFYRLVETYGSDAADEASMCSEPVQQGRRITIKLWSHEAIEELRSALRRKPAPAPGPAVSCISA